MRQLFAFAVGLALILLSSTGTSSAQTIPLLFENFDNPPFPNLPPGWTTTTNRLPTGDWYDTTFSGVPGSIRVANCVDATIVQRLTSPSVDFTGYVGDSVSLWARRSGTFDAPLELEVSTNGGSSWTLLGTVPATTTIARYAFELPSFVDGASSVIFRYGHGGTGVGSAGTARLDDFTATGISTSLNDGDGSAVLSNNTPGILNGSLVFPRNSGAQTVLVTVTGVSTGLLDKVVLTVPATWSGFSGGNVTLGGAFLGKTPSIVGNDITINSAALGTTPGTISIGSLTSANPVGPLINGNDTWIVKTAKTGGVPDTILAPPRSYTIIPIQNIRTGGADGFGNSDPAGTTPAMTGQVVAVSGVATVQNQIISSSSTQTSFFIQNSGYGVQVFRSSTPSTSWIRGDSIIVKGAVVGFNGSTEVSPLSTASPDFFNVGAGLLPSPVVLPNANAISEQNEGKLVRVNDVAWDSVGKTFSSTVGPRNSFRTAPTDTGSLFLASTNSIVGTVIPDSGDVIGIVYQRTDLVNGVPPHKLASRDLLDIVSNLADGAGTATLANAGGGTYGASTVFPRNTSGQSVTVSITGTPSGTLDKVKLTVPVGWGSYSSSNVSVGGAFTGNTPAFSGNDIQINNALLSTTPGTITITGLTSPDPVGAGVSGANAWQVQTAILGGTLTNIGTLPSSHTIIPIQNLRTGGTDGFGNSDVGGTTPVLSNTVVAVQGVVTVPNRVLAETTSTSIIIQDGNYGIQVFRSGAQSHTTLLQGNLIVVKGNISAFNGNTEILPASVTAPNVFNLGSGSLPPAQVLPGASSIAESTEARLVKVLSVNWDSAGQLFVVSSSSASDNNFRTGTDPGTIYLNAVNDIDGTVIPVSSPLTGVVYHRTDWVGGGQQIYKIVPRNLVDLGASGVTTTVFGGWNMISNPVTTAADSLRQLFGANAAFPYAFAFSSVGGYQQDHTLENGVGYWGKFSAPDTRSFTGGTRTLDSIDVVAGWNMIGSISSPVDTATIISIPPGNRSSGNYWYGYGPPPAGYTAVTSVLPGKGYWVKANGPGRFVLVAGPVPEKAASVGRNVLETMNSVTIRDGEGRSQTLYFGESGEAVEYDMPPLPPEGAFDARFESRAGGAIVKTHAAGAALPIGIRSGVAPLTVSWRIKSGRYSLDGGEGLKPVEGEGAVTLSRALARLMLRSAGVEIPTEYILMQNYPNPFNPSTTIKFGLPVASRVRMEVYNLLGQRVSTLVNDLMMEAGYQMVEWNGTGAEGRPLGSGVYFVRLAADGPDGKTFADVRKMIFMK